MRKIYKTLLASALLLMLQVSAAFAVSVTYSLTTHVDGRTITATANVNSSADISNMMPGDLKRAYCTYSFYWDAALTQPVVSGDALQGTVYVDYEFNPPFVISGDGNLVYYFLTTQSSSGTNQRGWLRCYSDNMVGGYTANNLSNSDINAGQFDYALYGDAYALNIYNRATQHYIYPENTGASYSQAILRHGTANQGHRYNWQLYDNTNVVQGHETCAIGTQMYGSGNNQYMYFISNHWIGDVNANRNVSTNDEGQVTSAQYAWWFEESIPVTTAMQRYLVYKNYDDGGLRVTSHVAYFSTTTPKTEFNYNSYKPYRKTGYSYRFFKDEAMTQEYGDTEVKVKKTNDILIVYVLETPDYGEPYVTDHWITMVIPYPIDNVASRFGKAADGVSPAVRVLEYYALESNEGGTKFDLKFKSVNAMQPHVPYLFKADEVLEGKYMVLTLNPGQALNEDWALRETSIRKFQDTNYDSPFVTMAGTYTGKELTVQASESDPLYFYFGWAGGTTYNFYRVTKKNVTMPNHRCYFYITPKDGASLTGAKFFLTDASGVFDEVITTIDGVEADDLVRTTGRIYNLNGQVVGNDLEALPRGVYIVNGKKVMK